MLTERFDRLFQYAEVILYLTIGLILFITGVFLIYDIVLILFEFHQVEEFVRWIVEILDRTLLLIMIIEIIYTIRVSFRERVLCSEPFLIVGLIAAIRRILIIGVESVYFPEKFTMFMVEMGVLGGLVLVFVASIILLRKGRKQKSSSV